MIVPANDGQSAFFYVLGGIGGDSLAPDGENETDSVIFARISPEDIVGEDYTLNGDYLAEVFTVPTEPENDFSDSRIRSIIWTTDIPRTDFTQTPQDIILEYRVAERPDPDQPCPSTPVWKEDVGKNGWVTADGAPNDDDRWSQPGFNSVDVYTGTEKLSTLPRHCNLQYRARFVRGDAASNLTPSLLNVKVRFTVPNSPDLKVLAQADDTPHIVPIWTDDVANEELADIEVVITNDYRDEEGNPLALDVEDQFFVDLLVFPVDTAQQFITPTQPLSETRLLSDTTGWVSTQVNGLAATKIVDNVLVTSTLQIRNWYDYTQGAGDPVLNSKNLLTFFPSSGDYRVCVVTDSYYAPELEDLEPTGLVPELLPDLETAEANNVSCTDPFTVETTATQRLSVSTATPVISETAELSQTGVFSITREGSTAINLPVRWKIGGSAKLGVDYDLFVGESTTPDNTSTVTRTLTLAADQSEIGIRIEPRDDQLIEGDKDIILTLIDSPNERYTLVEPISATIVISDDDILPAISTRSRDAFIDEDRLVDGSITIEVANDAILYDDLAIAFTSDSTLEYGRDYRFESTNYLSMTKMMTDSGVFTVSNHLAASEVFSGSTVISATTKTTTITVTLLDAIRSTIPPEGSAQIRLEVLAPDDGSYELSTDQGNTFIARLSVNNRIEQLFTSYLPLIRRQ
ncbi:MAG: hypothetical protein HC837_12070 [Chloroflexaceae bacterium]|nr:hypothetical protein [Chloroflexaceae bacterium]